MSQSKLISTLCGCLIAGSITIVQAGTPINLEQAIHASELSTTPYQLTVSLYENKEDKDPIAVQSYYQEEWTTNMDISHGIPDDDVEIKFAMQFDQIEQRKPGETLWVETRVDGKVVGARSALSIPTSSAFRVENDGGILIQGTGSGGGSIPISGAGVRMMWYPAKAAFRSGGVSGSHWGDFQNGLYSTAFGFNTIATGIYSTAMGHETVAFDNSVTVVGKFNERWVGEDRLFIVGNGINDSERSDAMVVRANGDVGIGEPLPTTRLHVVDEINGNGTLLTSYVGLIENTSSGSSADGLAIKIGTTGVPGTNANFMGFFDGDNDLVGQIEGNGTTGAVFITGGADYAEYLPQHDPDESLSAGDIVGVFSGQITHTTAGAAQVMVITDRAAVLGNMPKNKDAADGYQAVSFIGQVPVKVRGVVKSGDVILASGKQDGTGIAVSVETLASMDQAQIVGRAWASSDDAGLKKVMVAVGLDHTDMAMVQVKHLQTALQQQQQQHQQEILALRTELSEYKMLAAEIRQIKNQLLIQPQLIAEAFR